MACCSPLKAATSCCTPYDAWTMKYLLLIVVVLLVTVIAFLLGLAITSRENSQGSRDAPLDTLADELVENIPRGSTGFTDKYPSQATEGFDVILANPPFKGSLDFEDVHSGLLRQVKTKKTELLFLALILRMLNTGGRSATIVPDGVLFGSSGAHRQLRQLLVDQNQLEAVISLPSGVFRPYAGVSTGILVFTKGGRTDNVFFYDVEADGLSLDDKRDPVKENDLPDCLASWRSRNPAKDTDRTSKAFFVSATEIKEAGYDLSLSRYKERVYEEEDYEPPHEILSRMNRLNNEIAGDLAELEELL